MTSPRIQFDKISFDFQTENGPLRVVDDVSLDIHENEFICIVGPSGCGKTTLRCHLDTRDIPVRQLH